MIFSEVMHHYPAYDFEKCLQESSLVTTGLYLTIPGIQEKRVWPTVQLMAFYGNSQGGKGGGQKLDDSKVFRWAEFLPSWAISVEMREKMDQEFRLEPHHCWVFSRALEDGDLSNASWVLQIVAGKDDLERIHHVADRYSELPIDE